MRERVLRRTNNAVRGDGREYITETITFASSASNLEMGGAEMRRPTARVGRQPTSLAVDGRFRCRCVMPCLSSGALMRCGRVAFVYLSPADVVVVVGGATPGKYECTYTHTCDTLAAAKAHTHAALVWLRDEMVMS